MQMFLTIPFLQILFLIFFFVRPLRLQKIFKLLIAIALACACLKNFAYLFIENATIMDLKLSKKTAFILDIIYFTSIFIFIFTLSRSIINGIYKLASFDVRKYIINPHSKVAAIVITLLAALIGLKGVINGFAPPEDTFYSISMDNLRPEYKGFKIVLLSDLHISAPTSEQEIIDIVERVNALNADMVAITGDFVDGDVLELSEKTKHLFSLQSRFGTYAVSGNHEFYSGYSSWMEYFSEGGIHMLENDSVILKDIHGIGILNVAGIVDIASLRQKSDYLTKRGAKTNLKKAFKKVDRTLPVVFLTHQPSVSVKTMDKSDLTLSGHTHGGLAPLLKNIVSAKNSGFVSGLYDFGKQRVIVSNGTRIWAGVPLRLNTPAQIVVIELK